MKTQKQSALIFMEKQELPERSDVEAALEDMGAKLRWQPDHELPGMLALSMKLDKGEIGVSILGAALDPELYSKMLEESGLPPAEHKAIANHGSHARLVFMAEEEPIEPVNRMAFVYQVAARLCTLDGIAVLAPGSGVFVLGLEPAHVDEPLNKDVPPLDMWIGVEKKGDDRAASYGAATLGIPDVELSGIGILDDEATFGTMMDVLLYLRRIRRELVEGERLHVGQQPWEWLALAGTKTLVKLQRVDLTSGDKS